MTAGENLLAGGALKSFVERVERLENQKSSTSDEIKVVFGEAKAQGFDTRTLRKVIRERRKPAEQRQEERMLEDLYLQALGLLP